MTNKPDYLYLRDSDEYYDDIYSYAPEDESAIQYIRADIAAERERKLIATIRKSTRYALPCEEHIYRRAKLEMPKWDEAINRIDFCDARRDALTRDELIDLAHLEAGLEKIK